MRKHFYSARDLFLPVIDFFYPPFRRIMNLQAFRYAVSGASNTLVGLSVYIISFKWMLKEEILDIGFFAFESHVAALFISFCFSFPFGFFLMKYLVFSDSNLRGKVQLFRYFLVYLINLCLNYILLKLFVELFHIYPIPAQIFTIAILILFSYVFQRHFTFRVKPANNINS